MQHKSGQLQKCYLKWEIMTNNIFVAK